MISCSNLKNCFTATIITLLIAAGCKSPMAPSKQKNTIRKMEILSGMKEAAMERNYTLSIVNENNFNKDSSASFDAAAFMRFTPGKFEKINHLKEKGIPTVLINRFPEDNDTSYVTVDFTEEAFKGVEYLLSIGHEKIGIIGAPDNSDVARWRKAGYFN